MRRVLTVIATFSLLACGAPALTPQTACEEQVDGTCDKMWNCPNAAIKIGSDLESCKTQYKALCSLLTPCKDGTTFDASNAAACNPAIKAQSCDEYKAGPPSVCTNQCK